ncbi:MAG: PDZ domain-containing protein [Isosphaerales bacterium]
MPGSAADAAGLQIGDVVTAVDRNPVADIRGMVQVIRRKRVGDRVFVEFIRGGQAHQVDPILQRRQR